MKEYLDINIGLGSRQIGLPKSLHTAIGNTQDPTEGQCNAAGWREIVEVVPPPEGMSATGWEVVQINEKECKIVCNSWIDPVAEEARRKAEKLASITPELISLAQMYRSLLREYFGANAETNKSVTEKIVAMYFLQLQQLGTITAKQLADKDAMAYFFEQLNIWWGTGETWTFPWEIIP